MENRRRFLDKCLYLAEGYRMKRFYKRILWFIFNQTKEEVPRRCLSCRVINEYGFTLAHDCNTVLLSPAFRTYVV